MKGFSAVVLFLLILGAGAPAQAQASPGSGVGNTYFASIYGVKCDGTTDDTTALSNLATMVHTSAGNGGGTIVLPSTGNWCKISGAALNWPANVNLQGCGMYGSNLGPPFTAPPCGLDLRYSSALTMPDAKITFSDRGQVIFRDLAIVDNNPSECPMTPLPFFLVTDTVVHFQNVSIKGATPTGMGTPNLNNCNDGFVLGKNSDDCSNNFRGYGSTFQNIFFSQTKRFFVLGVSANGSDFSYIFGDGTNGDGLDGGGSGSAASGSAIEINASGCSMGGDAYGNTFKNIQIEQGDLAGDLVYNYAIDVKGNAGSNYVFGITCSDVPLAHPMACVHIGSSSDRVFPQMVLGCWTNADPLDFPGCVMSENIGSFSDVVADLFNAAPRFFAQTIYGANLGDHNLGHNWNYLYLSYLGLEATTLGHLPTGTSRVTGMLVNVSDANTPTDCTSAGGGSTLVTCRYNGSAWVALGSGNVSGPGSSTAGDVPYFSDTTGTNLADSNILYTNIPTMASNGTAGNVITSAGLKALQDSGTALSSLSGIGFCSSKVVTALNGGAGPTCSTITSAYVDATVCSDASCTQNTSGTASNLSGTPPLPNGATAVTQSAYSGDTKLATDNYVDGQTKPVFSTAVTGLSMSTVAGTVLSGPTTMVASPNTGTYRLNFQIIPTTAGSGGGLCSQGSVAISLGYEDADTSGVISVGTSGAANENILFYALNSSAPSQTVSYTNQTVGTVGTIFTGVARDIRVSSITPVTYQVWQVLPSNCSTPPVFAVRPAVWYLGY